MSKRKIDEIDASITTLPTFSSEDSNAEGWKNLVLTHQRQEATNLLKKFQKLESEIDKRILLEKRCHLPLKCDMQYTQKTLRLFVRHTFHPTPDKSEKGYFMLWIDGMTFQEGSSEYTQGLQSTLDRVYIEIDKKQAYNCYTYEWKLTDYPEGCSAQSIFLKIPVDKNCSARISLYLMNDFSSKYQIQNETLKYMLPQITCETSEEEICTALLHYIQNNNLFSERDRKYFRCDSNLKEVLGVESLAVSNLRSKLLANHLILPYPIQFDHQLNTNNTHEHVQSIVSNNLRLSTAMLLPRIGGRVIDLPINVLDESRFKYIHEMNQLAQTELLEEGNERQIISKAQFIVREIQENDFLLKELHQILREFQTNSPFLTNRPLETSYSYEFPQPPMLFDLVASRAPLSKNKFTHPIRTVDSSLHTLGAFLDVGNPKLFNPSQEWLQEICKTISSIERTPTNTSSTQGSQGQQPPMTQSVPPVTAAAASNTTSSSSQSS